MNSQWTTIPSGNLHLFQCGVLHGIQCRYLLWSGPLRGLQGNAFYTVVSSIGCRGISAVVPGSTSSFSFSELPVSHSFFLTPQCCVAFCLFLPTFSQRCHYLCWKAQLCVCWSHLEMSVSSMGQPLASQRLPCRPTCNTWTPATV